MRDVRSRSQKGRDKLGRCAACGQHEAVVAVAVCHAVVLFCQPARAGCIHCSAQTTRRRHPRASSSRRSAVKALTANVRRQQQ